jgi:hypothetical protein
MTLTPAQPRHEARLPDLNVWMQTTEVVLLVIKRYSPACVWVPAHDGRGLHGLLYRAAV